PYALPIWPVPISACQPRLPSADAISTTTAACAPSAPAKESGPTTSNQATANAPTTTCPVSKATAKPTGHSRSLIASDTAIHAPNDTAVAMAAPKPASDGTHHQLSARLSKAAPHMTPIDNRVRSDF